MGFSIGKAFQYLEHAPIGDSLRHCPKGIKNCKIYYSKVAPDTIQKTVVRNNGTTVSGTFFGNANNYELAGTKIENARGFIARSNGGIPFDRVTQVSTNNGDYLIRLAHSDRPNFMDSFHPRNGVEQSGDFSQELKNMMDYILGY